MMIKRMGKLIIWIRKLILTLVSFFNKHQNTKVMAQFTAGQEVIYQGNKYTVTNIVEETTYELTPVPTPPVVLEGIPESQIQGE